MILSENVNVKINEDTTITFHITDYCSSNSVTISRTEFRKGVANDNLILRDDCWSVYVQIKPPTVEGTLFNYPLNEENWKRLKTLTE